MTWYLLDTNHLSAYVDQGPILAPRVEIAIHEGHRFGITLPVLCEYRGGIAQGSRYQRNLARLNRAMELLRLWPMDEQTSIEFADIASELRALGRIIGAFDTLIAASVRQLGLTLLTADSDFHAVPRLKVENWLV